MKHHNPCCDYCEDVRDHRETGLLIFRGWATCLALLPLVREHPEDVTTKAMLYAGEWR